MSLGGGTIGRNALINFCARCFISYWLAYDGASIERANVLGMAGDVDAATTGVWSMGAGSTLLLAMASMQASTEPSAAPSNALTISLSHPLPERAFVAIERAASVHRTVARHWRGVHSMHKRAIVDNDSRTAQPISFFNSYLLRHHWRCLSILGNPFSNRISIIVILNIRPIPSHVPHLGPSFPKVPVLLPQPMHAY